MQICLSIYLLVLLTLPVPLSELLARQRSVERFAPPRAMLRQALRHHLWMEQSPDMPVVQPDPNTDCKIKTAPLDSGIDYKIIVVDPFVRKSLPSIRGGLLPEAFGALLDAVRTDTSNTVSEK